MIGLSFETQLFEMYLQFLVAIISIFVHRHFRLYKTACLLILRKMKTALAQQQEVSYIKS